MLKTPVENPCSRVKTTPSIEDPVNDGTVLSSILLTVCIHLWFVSNLDHCRNLGGSAIGWNEGYFQCYGHFYQEQTGN